MLDIYKASAGSGKTFALTLEYFRIIFETPFEYKNILAVTFTNKATEEMKSRIINELHHLAEGENSSYGDILKKDLELTNEQLKNKASLLRTLLLHDYGRLSVTTIDRFFQRIIKAFTHELGIFSGYNVELDSEFVLVKAVDKIMQQVKNKPELKSWIAELMSNSVEEGKSWSVKTKIAELGEELFRENYMLFDKHILEKFGDKQFLKGYRNFLSAIIQDYERKQTEIGEKAVSLIRESGLEAADFKGGKAGCAWYFYKLVNGTFDEPTATVRKGLTGPESWTTKTSGNKSAIEAICPALISLMEEVLSIFDNDYIYYTSAVQLQGNLYQLGILNDLYQEVRSYCDEKGLMLLSDTTHILNLLIADNDTSFLFEKCGNFYKHLMIDEFQDTSAMQWKNFKPLVSNSLGEGCRAMIVGDVKQSIYRWRNGDWRLLAYDIEKQFKHLGVNNVVLNDNWRSAREIVLFNNLFFEKATDVLTTLYAKDAEADDPGTATIKKAYSDLKQNARKDKRGYVDIHFGPDKQEEEGENMILSRIVADIQDIRKRGGRQKDIVILVRSGKEGAMVANYLMEYNKNTEIPVNFISNDSLYIQSSIYVQFIIAILKYMTEPYDIVNTATILYFYHTFVKGSGMATHEILKGIGEEEMFTVLHTDFAADSEPMLAYSLYETIESIINRFSLKNSKEEIPYLIAFQDTVYEYETNNSNSITLFLEWWEKEKIKRVLSTSEEVDAVRILTIHKSKGLEFEYVILPFCVWELDSVRPVRRIWCHNNVQGFNELDYAPLNYSSKLANTIFRKDYFDEHLKAFIDNLNLLYVALTRAKKELYIRAFSPKINKDGSVSVTDAGTFIYEILKHIQDALPEGSYMEDDSTFVWGGKEELGIPNKGETTSISLESYPIWHPEGRINVKYRFRDYTDLENTGLSAIDEGKLLHEIFKSIQQAGDVEYAVQHAYLSGLIHLEEKEEYCAKIARYLSNPATSEWFSPKAKIITEKDILFPDGNKARPDRVVIIGDTLRVIDYKFGQMEEAKYLKQVRFYCNTLIKMGYPKVEGYIWYVKSDKIVTV